LPNFAWIAGQFRTSQHEQSMRQARPSYRRFLVTA